MKTKLSFFALSCLFLCSFISYAQQAPLAQPNMMQVLRSPATQQNMKNGMKSGLRLFWNGKGTNLMAIGLFQDPDIRKAWDVSDEQHQQIQDVPKNMSMTVMNKLREIPEFRTLAEEGKVLQSQHPGDPLLQKADAETQKKFSDIQTRMGALATDISINTMVDSTEAILTPEQKRKMAEAMLASMEENPLISPSMFEALDLTEEQKQQMEEIKKELEPEFEKNLESVADLQMTLLNMMFDEFEKQGDAASTLNPDPKTVGKEFAEKMQTAVKKLAAENPEFKKMNEEITKQGKQFSTQFKVKMFDVLTDEQWKRLLDLTDNPPEYAKLLRKKLQEQKEARTKSASWQPGPDSWKPGDAIPEEYRKERSSGRRFPRQEN